MTRREILKLQCRLRRGVNRLYHRYLESVLRELGADDHANVGHATANVAAHRARHQPAYAKPRDRAVAARQLKLRGDLGCARVREQLWRLQHV